MAADLYSRINELLNKMDRIKNETSSDNICKTELASMSLSDFETLNKNLSNLIAVTQRAHANAQKEASVLYQTATHFEKFDKMAKQELTNRIGGAVTGRIMAGR